MQACPADSVPWYLICAVAGPIMTGETMVAMVAIVEME
jgi:hypothetical protein